MPTFRNLTRHKKNKLAKDRQSRIAWQTVNEVIKRKSTLKTKLKAAT